MEKGINELTRQRVSEALFLVGVGVVWAFHLWWPGILVAFGVPWSASLAIRRKYWAAVVVVTLLCLVPAMYLILAAWNTIAPLIVAGIGVAGLARAAYLRDA